MPLIVAFLVTFLVLTPGLAVALPLGMTGVGNVGVASPNGVVTAPPKYGPNFYYVSTANGASGGGFIPGAAGNTRTGSQLATKPFEASAGSELRFFFNYISTDGGDYPDYAWSILKDASTGDTAAVLFTARTKPSGPIVPGQWLPPADATLDPAEVYMKPGGPAWNKLGGSSGACYDAGCGYTGWVASSYEIEASGVYRLLFGVSNWTDDAYDSGLAIAGATLDDIQIAPVPLPPAAPLMAIGVAALVLLRRRPAVGPLTPR
jgi:hypothetical protein